MQRLSREYGQSKKAMTKAGITTLLLSGLLVIACKREERVNTSECHADIYPFCPTHEPTQRKLENHAATVVESSGTFYIIPQNTFDTKLLPCNLDPAFLIHKLKVAISGDVKNTLISSNTPCCVENFIITCIKKQ